MENLDSREILDRITELESEDDLDETDKSELEAAKALIDEIGEDIAEGGVYLIAEYDFEEYAREFAEEIGAIGKDGGWPTYCIDWEWAARELRMDFTEVEYNGVTYLYQE